MAAPRHPQPSEAPPPQPDFGERARRPPQIVLVLLALTALVTGLEATALVLADADEIGQALYDVLITAPVGWAFVAVGLWGWVRWPAARLGVITVALGFAWMLGALNESGTPLVYVAGELVRPLFIALLGHLLLAFPSGRVGGGWRRLDLAALYLGVTALWLPRFLVSPEPNPGCDTCPANPIAVVDSQVLLAGFSRLHLVVVGLAWLGVLASLLAHLRAAPDQHRHALAAMVSAGFAAFLFLASVAESRPELSPLDGDIVAAVGALAWGLVPFLVLAAGRALSRHGRPARPLRVRWTIAALVGVVSIAAGLLAFSVVSLAPDLRPSQVEGALGFEAERMSHGDRVGTIADSAAGGGAALAFEKNGSASIGHTTSGEETVVVRARGDQCRGAPSIELSIDGRPTPLPAVTTTTWADYSATIDVASGRHRFDLAYRNNLVSGDCDRNLYVDRVTFPAR